MNRLKMAAAAAAIILAATCLGLLPAALGRNSSSGAAARASAPPGPLMPPVEDILSAAGSARACVSFRIVDRANSPRSSSGGRASSCRPLKTTRRSSTRPAARSTPRASMAVGRRRSEAVCRDCRTPTTVRTSSSATCRPCRRSAACWTELMRVLRPGGLAYVGQSAETAARGEGFSAEALTGASGGRRDRKLRHRPKCAGSGPGSDGPGPRAWAIGATAAGARRATIRASTTSWSRPRSTPSGLPGRVASRNSACVLASSRQRAAAARRHHPRGPLRAAARARPDPGVRRVQRGLAVGAAAGGARRRRIGGRRATAFSPPGSEDALRTERRGWRRGLEAVGRGNPAGHEVLGPVSLGRRRAGGRRLRYPAPARRWSLRQKALLGPVAGGRVGDLEAPARGRHPLVRLGRGTVLLLQRPPTWRPSGSPRAGSVAPAGRWTGQRSAIIRARCTRIRRPSPPPTASRARRGNFRGVLVGDRVYAGGLKGVTASRSGDRRRGEVLPRAPRPVLPQDGHSRRLLLHVRPVHHADRLDALLLLQLRRHGHRRPGPQRVVPVRELSLELPHRRDRRQRAGIQLAQRLRLLVRRSRRRLAGARGRGVLLGPARIEPSAPVGEGAGLRGRHRAPRRPATLALFSPRRGPQQRHRRPVAWPAGHRVAGEPARQAHAAGRSRRERFRRLRQSLGLCPGRRHGQPPAGDSSPAARSGPARPGGRAGSTSAARTAGCIASAPTRAGSSGVSAAPRTSARCSSTGGRSRSGRSPAE